MSSTSGSTVLRDARRIVVKVGSSLVTNEGRGLDEAAIGEWCRQLAALVRDGREVVMVSSGAIAEGMKRLGWRTRPHEIHELQAAAAVGQMGLAQVYETKLRENGMGSAQVLLTHADLADRERYLNARSTLVTLLALGVVPVINENDTVVTDEIKFGDNDTLGALVANLVEADALVILTDQKGLFTADPRKDPAARFVDEAAAGKCPVIPSGFLEADHHVLHVEAGAREICGEYFQEFLLHFDAASHRPQNLDEDEVFVAIGLRIGIGRIKAKVLGVEFDHALKPVRRGNPGRD